MECSNDNTNLRKNNFWGAKKRGCEIRVWFPARTQESQAEPDFWFLMKGPVLYSSHHFIKIGQE